MAHAHTYIRTQSRTLHTYIHIIGRPFARIGVCGGGGEGRGGEGEGVQLAEECLHKVHSLIDSWLCCGLQVEDSLPLDQ